MIRKYSACITIILGLSVLSACTGNDPDPVKMQLPFNHKGFFIVNEGNYTWGNGSLDFFSYDSLRLYSSVFSNIAGKVVGDIPLRITKHENRLYIVVNNSGKIEVLDIDNQMPYSTIQGLISPRDIKIIDNSRAIVSSLYSDSLAIIDISGSSVSGYIDIGKSSECILVDHNYIYVSNWSGSSSITVLKKNSFEIVATIETALEPSEMVLDKAGQVWVICSGGYLNEDYPELISIDPSLLEITKTLRFGVKECSPSELIINSTRDTLYYINDDIFRLSYNDSELPIIPFIESDDRNFYRLGFDNSMNTIIATDALDYVQKGYFYIYSQNGSELGKYRAGIIPGKINN